MVRLTESRIRQIIKEEIQRESLRVMTQRERMPVAPKIMPYSVAIEQDRNPRVEVERAIEAAIERAKNDYPEIEWDLDDSGKHGSGVMPRRSPRDEWDTTSYVVWLRQVGPAEGY